MVPQPGRTLDLQRKEELILQKQIRQSTAKIKQNLPTLIGGLLGDNIWPSLEHYHFRGITRFQQQEAAVSSLPARQCPVPASELSDGGGWLRECGHWWSSQPLQCPSQTEIREQVTGNILISFYLSDLMAKEMKTLFEQTCVYWLLFSFFTIWINSQESKSQFNLFCF